MSAPALAAVAAACAVAALWEALPLLGRLRVVAVAGLGGAFGASHGDRERLRSRLVAAASLAAAGMTLAGPGGALLSGAGAPLAVGWAQRTARERRRRQVAASMPTVARAVADAVAGGHSLQGALREALRGLSGPGADELARVVAEIELGAGTAEALDRLERRVAEPGWAAMVAAVTLARDLGGDLSDLLRTIASGSEEAVRAGASARLLTAQARATARLLAGAPVLVICASELLMPGTLSAIARDGLALVLSGAAVALGTAAAIVLSALTRGVDAP